MRPLILVLLAIGAATLLGCQESGFDERKETARPLKVQHELGETKVPGMSQRPLTLTLDTLDDTLALHVRPARAAVPGRRLPDYLRGPAGDLGLMPPVVTGAALPAVSAVRADLILGNETGQKRLYDALTKIAPTVIISSESSQWKLNVRLVGEALGRTNAAEALLTDYDGRVARVRRSLHGRRSVAVVRTTPRGVEVAPQLSFAGTILADAGVRQARSVRSADVVVRDRPEVWWGPGGLLAARAALADLKRILSR